MNLVYFDSPFVLLTASSSLLTGDTWLTCSDAHLFDRLGLPRTQPRIVSSLSSLRPPATQIPTSSMNPAANLLSYNPFRSPTQQTRNPTTTAERAAAPSSA